MEPNMVNVYEQSVSTFLFENSRSWRQVPQFGPPDEEAIAVMVDKISTLMVDNGRVEKADVRKIIAEAIFPGIADFPPYIQGTDFPYEEFMQYIGECRLKGNPLDWTRIRFMAL